MSLKEKPQASETEDRKESEEIVPAVSEQVIEDEGLTKDVQEMERQDATQIAELRENNNKEKKEEQERLIFNLSRAGVSFESVAVNAKGYLEAKDAHQADRSKNDTVRFLALGHADFFKDLDYQKSRSFQLPLLQDPEVIKKSQNSKEVKNQMSALMFDARIVGGTLSMTSDVLTDKIDLHGEKEGSMESAANDIRLAGLAFQKASGEAGILKNSKGKSLLRLNSGQDFEDKKATFIESINEAYGHFYKNEIAKRFSLPGIDISDVKRAKNPGEIQSLLDGLQKNLMTVGQTLEKTGLLLLEKSGGKA